MTDFIIDVPLQGPRGLQGDPGEDGAQGEIGPPGQTGLRGTKMFTGTGAPNVVGPLTGDLYLDTQSYLLYGPYAGGWPPGVPYAGPPGSPGSQGPQGNPGNATIFGSITVGNVPKFKTSTQVEDSGIAFSSIVTQTFAAGTKMLFVQSTAPTGWTKDTDHNDKALRIVSGTASSGGSLAFSTVFARTATDGHQLTIAEMPAHTHTLPQAAVGAVSTLTIHYTGGPMTAVTGSTGGDTAHTHNIDLRVQYVDVIKATKN